MLTGHSKLHPTVLRAAMITWRSRKSGCSGFSSTFEDNQRIKPSADGYL